MCWDLFLEFIAYFSIKLGHFTAIIQPNGLFFFIFIVRATKLMCFAHDRPVEPPLFGVFLPSVPSGRFAPFSKKFFFLCPVASLPPL